MRFDGGFKHMSVEKLRALLADLPPDYRVTPNGVGNLALADVDLHYVGYIDVADETIDLGVR